MHLPAGTHLPKRSENRLLDFIFPLAGYDDVEGYVHDSQQTDNSGRLICQQYASDRGGWDDAIGNQNMGSGGNSGGQGMYQRDLSKRHPMVCNGTWVPANFGGGEGAMDHAVEIGDGSTSMGYTEAAPYGSGDSLRSPETIPSGLPFAGRAAGGLNRASVFSGQ